MKSKFHSGEIAIQIRAGVQDTASRVAGVIRSTIPPVAQDFLQTQRILILSTLDSESRVWASLLTGEPGFVQAVDEQTVRIDAKPVPGDPVNENLKNRDEVGVLAIEFATRRRMKIKGRAELREPGIYVHVERVYTLCPKYIQARELVADVNESRRENVRRVQTLLTEEQRRWIERADTFFIASFHPETGADASHRGGNSGFVRTSDKNTIVFPDYSGNKMFNTLGNIFANPNAGLIFIDFEKGNTLQITGKARVVWDENLVKEFVGAERLVEFEIEQAVKITEAIPLEWRFIEYSPFNPV